MSMSSERNEDSVHSSDDVVQWLMIAAIIVSGVAVTAMWFYLQW